MTSKHPRRLTAGGHTPRPVNDISAIKFVPHKLSILQVGDIHYPERKAETARIDLKANPFGASDVLRPKGQLFEEALRLFMQLANDDVEAIAFVGDLTTAGDLVGYEEIVKKLALDVLPSFFDRAEISARVIVVPGNHDVDWPSCLSASTAPERLLKKFAPFQEILSRYGLTNFPLANPCSVTVGADPKLTLFGINTCLGCGELSAFPEPIQEKVRDEMKRILGKRIPGAVLDPADIELLTERLDAPLVARNVLDQIDEALMGTHHLGERTPFVVIGHHNLLPQLTPRIAPFAELMNSGALRAILAGKQQPIIYLHGHIHADPIEIILNEANRKGGVFSVSAPEFHRGFNKITFWFDQRLRPLGTEIIPYRLDDHGNRDRKPSQKIPHGLGPHKLAGMSSLARQILSSMGKKNESLYFRDLYDTHRSADPVSIFHALHELAWVNAVQIENIDDHPAEWYIRTAV